MMSIRLKRNCCALFGREQLKFSIVTPTYSEAENLPRLVSALFAFPLDLRVLIVDDNSPDGRRSGRVSRWVKTSWLGQN